ncbi:hypothetical protein B0H14DRAFT_2794486 [Mycena olivaceomarginata]|nr:hypothetical protein B0H14DRAFT_2794486 [Mycena olivaceomarginata]
MSSFTFIYLYLQALWRLVRAPFGRSRRETDVEEGTFAVSFPGKEVAVVVAEPVPTFKPDTSGVPMLVLASMAVGAAHLRTEVFPGPRLIPLIVVTPPPIDDIPGKKDELDVLPSKALNVQHHPPRPVTNTIPRVHGKVPRKARLEKENLRDHPNVPRLAHRNAVEGAPLSLASVCPLVKHEAVNGAEPSDEDIPVKVALNQIPNTSHQSISVRLSPSPSLASATSSESIASVLNSVLDTFEADLNSPLWLGLPQFGEFVGKAEGVAGSVSENSDSDAYSWMEDREGDAFYGEEDSSDDHWSDVVSLDEYSLDGY